MGHNIAPLMTGSQRIQVVTGWPMMPSSQKTMN
jgi:hypothetical protein